MHLIGKHHRSRVCWGVANRCTREMLAARRTPWKAFLKDNKIIRKFRSDTASDSAWKVSILSMIGRM
jgi:hypothetical protein